MTITQNPESATIPRDASLHTERRIAVLTLIFGLAASLAAAATNHRDWATGLISGAALAWLNFRLLRRALDALVAASTAQSTAAKPRVPTTAYLGALFRYALIALVVYVIFRFLKVPLASLVVGLCSLAAAALAASVYELIRPGK
jgi:small-conductance mechanosensitive channel